MSVARASDWKFSEHDYMPDSAVHVSNEANPKIVDAKNLPPFFVTS